MLNTLHKVEDHENHAGWIYLTTVLYMGIRFLKSEVWRKQITKCRGGVGVVSGWRRGGVGVVSGWRRGGVGVASGWRRGGVGVRRGGVGVASGWCRGAFCEQYVTLA